MFDRLDKFLSARYDEQDAYFIMIKHFKMAQIYYDRQLLDLCKRIAQSRNTAESNHCYAEQLLIYKLKEKLIRGLQTPADYETLHNEFILKESETFNLYSNLSHFKHLDSEFVVALNKLNAISSDVALNEIKRFGTTHYYLMKIKRNLYYQNIFIIRLRLRVLICLVRWMRV